MRIVFSYFFQLISKTCSLTYSVTFREAWEDSKSMKCLHMNLNFDRLIISSSVISDGQQRCTDGFVSKHAEGSIGESNLFHESC